MSKWISKDLFNKHLEEREKEKLEKIPRFNRSEIVWPSLKPGTQDEPTVYEGRFLPDPEGLLIKKYYYHMWKSGDKYISLLCPKTHGFGNFCPVCSVVSSLYNGTAEDKKIAREMKRKERYVSNFYIVDDPRDKNVKEEENKMSGKVRLYEFPSKINEKLIAEEDEKEGLRERVWDAGEDGHNFFIKIKLTKPDENKRQFPDYSSSVFSRKSTALGSDKKTEEITKSVYSLKKHVETMEKSLDWIKETLISEGLFKLVEREWAKHYENTAATTTTEDDVPDFTEDDKPSKGDTESEEDILKQLDDLKI